MTLYRINGKVINCKLGISNASSVEVAGAFKEVTWSEVHSVIPQTAANTVQPIDWHQGHKHVEGKLRAISELGAALFVNASGQKYLNPGQKNDKMQHFVINVELNDATLRRYVFADSIMTSSGVASVVVWGGEAGSVLDAETSYFEYPFKCTFMMVSGLHPAT